ncbi:hypothetical protein PG994_008002 [Apiospora phragmitis]|uniref:Uncharacterized protein n=1 Tax=Apiospora phragmitis TaxID=2905665 RepID=A0ABR1URT4_9PEZI
MATEILLAPGRRYPRKEDYIDVDMDSENGPDRAAEVIVDSCTLLAWPPVPVSLSAAYTRLAGPSLLLRSDNAGSLDIVTSLALFSERNAIAEQEDLGTLDRPSSRWRLHEKQWFNTAAPPPPPPAGTQPTGTTASPDGIDDDA